MNNKNSNINSVCNNILKEIIPNEKERKITLAFTKKLADRLQKKIIDSGLKGQVQIEGSIAKDTWLAGDKDIDIFIILPNENKKKDLLKILELVKELTGKNYVKAYAEHPYIKAEINNFKVEFVPCFKLKLGERIFSSVDRTPLHTVYIEKNLISALKNDVRLLKKFMQTIGVYGAEIKIGGFSGYLCEVLILNYGSFQKLLEASSNWKKGEIIDIKNYFKSNKIKLNLIHQNSLIVIDPVDERRNLAAAVRLEKLCTFIAASRKFLVNPQIKFFKLPNIEPISEKELKIAIKSRNSNIIFVKTGRVDAVPDVLWGQLFKSKMAIKNFCNKEAFRVINNSVWSDEEKNNVFIFEVYSKILPNAEKHLGPPIFNKKASERFLTKYSNSNKVLSGPKIEENRWIVERKRKNYNLSMLLKNKLKNGGKEIGVGKLVANTFLSAFEILINYEISNFYLKNRNFAIFLTKYLNSKPHWL